jgi:hypothetical protein
VVITAPADIVSLGLGDQGHDGFADVIIHGLEQIHPVVGLHVLHKPQHGLRVGCFQAGLLGFHMQLSEGVAGLVVADPHQNLDDRFRRTAAFFKRFGDIRRMQVPQGIDRIAGRRGIGNLGRAGGIEGMGHGAPPLGLETGIRPARRKAPEN